MKPRCVHLLLCFVLLPLQLKFEAFVGIYDDEKVESRTYEQLFHSRLYDLWERSRRSSCFGARCSTTWQQSCNNLFLLKLFLLLLSGDVHLNPGPTTCYPCSMCSRLVRWNQKALQCDSCHLWVHCQCYGVSNQQYSHYQQLLTFSWCCPPCWACDLPFHDCSVMDSTVSDDSIVSVVSSETETCYPSKLGTLRIAHLNCRSLLSHKDDVVAMFIAAQLDVLALTETWLDDTVVDSEILPCGSGLSLLRMVRNRCGGGVAFMVSTMVSFIVRPDLREGNVESLWIELFPRSKRSLLMCCAYRLPSKADFYDHFTSECERSLLSVSQKFLIVGDLNSDLLHPSYFTTVSSATKVYV